MFGLNAVDLILIRLALRNRSLYKDLLVKAEYMILVRTTTCAFQVIYLFFFSVRSIRLTVKFTKRFDHF